MYCSSPRSGPPCSPQCAKAAEGLGHRSRCLVRTRPGSESEPGKPVSVQPPALSSQAEQPQRLTKPTLSPQGPRRARAVQGLLASRLRCPWTCFRTPPPPEHTTCPCIGFPDPGCLRQKPPSAPTSDFLAHGGKTVCAPASTAQKHVCTGSSIICLSLRVKNIHYSDDPNLEAFPFGQVRCLVLRRRI